MKTKTITTNKATILVVDLPKEQFEVWFWKNTLYVTSEKSTMVELTHGKWSGLIKLSGVTEEQAVNLTYEEHIHANQVTLSHRETLDLIMRNYGINNWENPYILIKL